MPDRNSHCSFCGTPFGLDVDWPRTCAACGNRSYLNPLPVVVAIVPVAGGLVAVRRNIEPSKGPLTLPGGYLDLRETWQEGASRELLEETGILVAPGDFTLYDVANGLDDTLVILGLAAPQPAACLQPFTSDETQEVVLLDRPQVLGFPLHTKVAERFFKEAAASAVRT
jgi:ADP-ribose pyrophosphatase YjhB (NUDIX family)